MQLLEWLKSPAHYQYFALAAFLLVEWALPRTKKVEANSLLELAANILCRVPLVSRFAVAMATPRPTFVGSVDDIEARQKIRTAGRARIEILWLLAVGVAAALALSSCALPLQHVQRCDAMHARAMGWKATAVVAGALSGAGIATALGIDGRTGQRVAGASALVLGGMSSLAIFETGEAEHQYAIECEAPQIPAIVVDTVEPMPSPAPVAVTP